MTLVGPLFSTENRRVLALRVTVRPFWARWWQVLTDLSRPRPVASAHDVLDLLIPLLSAIIRLFVGVVSAPVMLRSTAPWNLGGALTGRKIACALKINPRRRSWGVVCCRSSKDLLQSRQAFFFLLKCSCQSLFLRRSVVSVRIWNRLVFSLRAGQISEKVLRAGPITPINVDAYLLPMASLEEVKSASALGVFELSLKQGLCSMSISPWSANFGALRRAFGFDQ